MIFPPKTTTVGKIVSKHGFKGNLNIHIESDFFDEVNEGDYLFVVIDQKGVPFLIESLNPNKQIVKLQFVDHEQSALELVGKEIAIPYSEDHLSHSDNQLQGFILKDQFDQTIGTIQGIETYPGHDMLIISCENREILIPLIEAWITNLDEESRTLQMTLPEGLTNPEDYED
jgi:16S rRNA processing protein RimM